MSHAEKFGAKDNKHSSQVYLALLSLLSIVRCIAVLPYIMLKKHIILAWLYLLQADTFNR